MSTGDVYLPANYIKFTGSQNIDTGVYGDNTTSVNISFYITTLVSGASRSFFGYYDSNNPTTKSLNIYLGYSGGSTRYGSASVSSDWRASRNYTCNITPTGYSGIGYRSASGSWSPSSFTTESTLKIGYTGTGGYFIGNVYSCQIKLGNTIVREFIPVYNQTKGEYGLLDTINNTFYGSITGTPLEGELTT